MNARQMSPCGLVVAYFALPPEFGFFPMNSRTFWIAVVVSIIAVWFIFFVAWAFLYWDGWGRVLARFGILETERAASGLCANDGACICKWRGLVQSNWRRDDVEIGIETNLPLPAYIPGRRNTV